MVSTCLIIFVMQEQKINPVISIVIHVGWTFTRHTVINEHVYCKEKRDTSGREADNRV